MARVAAYKNPDVKDKLLLELRAGKSLAEAAGQIMSPLRTVQGWLDKDADLRTEVERALEMGKEAQASHPIVLDKSTGTDRWRKLREDAARLGPGMFGSLLAIEARVLAQPGTVGLSPFMKHTAREFYAGEFHELLVIMGRGGTKSTANIFLSCNEMMFRKRHIPPNDPRWVWPFMSHSMAESNQRFEPFKTTLLAVGYGASDLATYQRKDGRSEIQFDDLAGQPVKINIFPNTVDACRGGNLAGATDDEELHWAADKDKGLFRADDVLEVLVGSFRADRSRVHIRISSVNDEGGAMMDAAEEGSNELRYVATLGPFLQTALDGFKSVATHLDSTGRADDAKRVRAWAATLTESSPWIPSWVGNPAHDALEGFKLLWSKLRKSQDRVGVWLRENGSCTLPVADEAGDFFTPEPTPDNPNPQSLIDRAVHTARVVTREYDGRYAAIDTGATRNPSGLAIVERVIHETRTNGVRVRRYQFRPVKIEQWAPRGTLPLDLRGVVLPAMARVVIDAGCVPVWWSDGWAGDAVQVVSAMFGIQTVFVSTSTATADIYEPLYAALTEDPCPVLLSGCPNAELAAEQLKQVRRGKNGVAIVPHTGKLHGEYGQTLARALAHAGVGKFPPVKSGQLPTFFHDRYSAHR